jgi:hypothetical protein
VKKHQRNKTGLSVISSVTGLTGKPRPRANVFPYSFTSQEPQTEKNLRRISQSIDDVRKNDGTVSTERDGTD